MVGNKETSIANNNYRLMEVQTGAKEKRDLAVSDDLQGKYAYPEKRAQTHSCF